MSDSARLCAECHQYHLGEESCEGRRERTAAHRPLQTFKQDVRSKLDELRDRYRTRGSEDRADE